MGGRAEEPGPASYAVGLYMSSVDNTIIYTALPMGGPGHSMGTWLWRSG